MAQMHDGGILIIHSSVLMFEDYNLDKLSPINIKKTR